MTLLELLRLELPKRGGWPEGANECVQDFSGVVKFFDSDSLRFNGTRWAGSPRGSFLCTDWNKIHGLTLSNDYATAIVTREQYEWDGEGLPPIGFDVEFTIGAYDMETDFDGILPAEGEIVQVVAHKTTSDGNDVAVVYWDDKGAGRSACFVPGCFRPLRTEAERAIDEMVRLSGVSIGAAKILYDAGYRKG